MHRLLCGHNSKCGRKVVYPDLVWTSGIHKAKASTAKLKANFFFDDCKINPITNNAIDKHVCFPCLFFHRSHLI